MALENNESLFRGTELKNKGMLDSAYNILIEALEHSEPYSDDWIKAAQLISEINNILHEEQYERDAVKLGKALQSLKQQ